MTSLKAQQLLWTLAKQYKQQKTSFSRSEIVAKINEIKYLAGQKNVPRLSLQKEIQHLEGKMQGIYDLEKKMWAQKTHESARIVMMKKEISKLRAKLAMTQDKELQKKVEKLSHLLANQAAKDDTTKDITLQQKFNEFKEAKKVEVPEVNREEKIRNLQVQLGKLKEMLPRVTADDMKKAMLEQQIIFLDDKLRGLLGVGSTPEVEVVVERPEGRHTLLFDATGFMLPKEDEMSMEKELPLPPPPKMRM